MGYRILYHHRTQALDGQRVHISAVQRALRDLGHDVIEVAPIPAVETAGGRTVPTWRRRALESVTRVTPKGAYEGLELAYNVVGYRALAAAIQDVRPDFIYERYALNTVAGAVASKRYDVPLLLEVNSPLADEKRALGQLMFYRAALQLERYTLRRAARVLAVTEVLAETLRGSANLPAGNVVVVHNGADVKTVERGVRDGAAIRAALPWGVDDVVLGAVGFFREWHGLDLMLKAFAASCRSRRTRLLFVGDGPALADLQRLTNGLGIQADVQFTGGVPHDAVPGYLAAMDAVVIPRAVDYASPLKLFEYMAAGKAVVAPRQPNLLEILTEGHDALCFERESIADLAGAMERVVDDTALRRGLGTAARRTIDRKQLTWTGNAQRIVDAFEALRPQPALRAAV